MIINELHFSFLCFVDGNTTRIRIYTTPDTLDQVDYALNATHSALRALNAYFNISYPLPKLDVVAIPEYEQGRGEWREREETEFIAQFFTFLLQLFSRCYGGIVVNLCSRLFFLIPAFPTLPFTTSPPSLSKDISRIGESSHSEFTIFCSTMSLDPPQIARYHFISFVLLIFFFFLPSVFIHLFISFIYYLVGRGRRDCARACTPVVWKSCNNEVVV